MAALASMVGTLVGLAGRRLGLSQRAQVPASLACFYALDTGTKRKVCPLLAEPDP